MNGSWTFYNSSGEAKEFLDTGTAITDVTASPPLASSGGATPNISLNSSVPVAKGGTGSDLSATGGTGQFVRQSSSGAAFTVSALTTSDVTGTTVDREEALAFTQATGSPATIFTPPANHIIKRVEVHITAAAAGSTPTVKVGTAGTSDLYMLTTEVDLLETGIYIVQPMADAGPTPAAVILTISAAGQSFTGIVYVTYGLPG